MAGPSRNRGDATVDFTGVETGGRSVPDGQYLLEVVSVEEKESSEGNAYLAWKWKVAEGPLKGATIYDNTSLKPTALWRLKGLLECMGFEVDGKFALNFREYVGKQVMANVANEVYQGKSKPRIGEFLRDEAPAASSGTSNPFKKGTKVEFDNEGEPGKGVVVGVEGDKIIVEVEVDDSKEEWEMSADELTIV